MAQRPRHEAYERCVQAPPRPLSGAEREAIAPLAHNLPALWQAPTTTMAERTEMVRPLMQRVMVAGAGRSERLQIPLAWVGGGSTAGLTTRPMSRPAPLRDDPLLCERIRTLVHAGYRTVQITTDLAQEGCHSAKHARPFSRPSGIERMRRVGGHQPRRRRRPPLNAPEWWCADVAGELGKAHSTLHQGRTRGWLRARWHDHSTRWVAWADEAERQRLTQRRVLPTG
jgi:hypothetical protein